MVDSNSVATISAASPRHPQREDRRTADFLCVICLETFDPRTAAIIARHQNSKLVQQDQQPEPESNEQEEMT